MTGWRLGYVIAPGDAIRTLQKAYQNFFISTNEFVQWAGLAALREAGEETSRFRAIFDERRRAMLDGLRAIGFSLASSRPGPSTCSRTRAGTLPIRSPSPGSSSTAPTSP